MDGSLSNDFQRLSTRASRLLFNMKAIACYKLPLYTYSFRKGKRFYDICMYISFPPLPDY